MKSSHLAKTCISLGPGGWWGIFCKLRKKYNKKHKMSDLVIIPVSSPFYVRCKIIITPLSATIAIQQTMTATWTHLHMTSFPLLSTTIFGIRQAGLTRRLEPRTMQRSAFLECSMADVSSLSGRFSPKLTMES